MTIKYSPKNEIFLTERNLSMPKNIVTDGMFGTTKTLSSRPEVCYFDFIRIQTSAKMACGGLHVDEWAEQGMSYEKFESEWDWLSHSLSVPVVKRSLGCQCSQGGLISPGDSDCVFLLHVALWSALGVFSEVHWGGVCNWLDWQAFCRLFHMVRLLLAHSSRLYIYSMSIRKLNPDTLIHRHITNNC